MRNASTSTKLDTRLHFAPPPSYVSLVSHIAEGYANPTPAEVIRPRRGGPPKFRIRSVVDEFTRECLAISVARKLKATDVIDVLSDLFVLRGVPDHIRSDNGPEFVAKPVQAWIAEVGKKTAFFTPGSPWEDGCVESFNAQLRDELLNGEIFYTLKDAQIMIESWRRH